MGLEQQVWSLGMGADPTATLPLASWRFKGLGLQTREESWWVSNPHILPSNYQLKLP